MPDAVLMLELFNDGVYRAIEGEARAMDRELPGKLGSMLIGGGTRIPRGCWVAKITGRDPVYRYARTFQRYRRDFSGASRTENRGVMAVYFLSPGIYEVQEQMSWKRTDRRFIRVDDAGDMAAISEEELCQTLDAI